MFFLGFLVFLAASVVASGCPYGDDPVQVTSTVNHPSPEQVSVTLSKLGQGQFGCAYEIIGGWPLQGTDAGSTMHVPAVAKTALPGREDTLNAEADALNGIHELYAEAYSDENTDSLAGLFDDNTWQQHWLVIKYHPGVYVTQTTAWQQRFPMGFNTDLSDDGIRECEAFMRSLYAKLADEGARYIIEYGWGYFDVNWDNFLWSDDLTQVNIIDWGGHAGPVAEGRDRKQSALSWSTPFQDALAKRSTFPLRDTVDRAVQYQGICQSKARMQEAQTALALADE